MWFTVSFPKSVISSRVVPTWCCRNCDFQDTCPTREARCPFYFRENKGIERCPRSVTQHVSDCATDKPPGASTPSTDQYEDLLWVKAVLGMASTTGTQTRPDSQNHEPLPSRSSDCGEEADSGWQIERQEHRRDARAGA